MRQGEPKFQQMFRNNGKALVLMDIQFIEVTKLSKIESLTFIRHELDKVSMRRILFNIMLIIRNPARYKNCIKYEKQVYDENQNQ
ncbi:hypothetical protein C9426_27300 [Serratia sp. S1B]|nr:hypothetical protein C9426_27300 [Serratia sp. S1B]